MTEKDVGSKRASEEPSDSAAEEHKKQKLSIELPAEQPPPPAEDNGTIAENSTMQAEEDNIQQSDVPTGQDLAAELVKTTSTEQEGTKIEEPTGRQETVTAPTEDIVDSVQADDAITNEQLVLALTSVQDMEAPPVADSAAKVVRTEAAADAQVQPSQKSVVSESDTSAEPAVVNTAISPTKAEHDLALPPSSVDLEDDLKPSAPLSSSSTTASIPTLASAVATSPSEPVSSSPKQPLIPSATNNATMATSSATTSAPAIPTSSLNPTNTTSTAAMTALSPTTHTLSNNNNISSSSVSNQQQQQQQQQSLSAALNSLPNISAALRRLSNASVPASVIEQLSSPRLTSTGAMNDRKGSIDTLPSEILGNALAAVAAVRNNQVTSNIASPNPNQQQQQQQQQQQLQQQPLQHQQQNSPSAQATATAIGNLAAITANISSLLHSGGFHRNSFSQEDTQKLAAAVAVARSNSVSQQGQLPVHEQQRRKSSMALMGNAFSNMIDQAAMMLGRNKSFSSEGGKLPSQQQPQEQQSLYNTSSLKANHLYLPQQQQQQQQQQPNIFNNHAAFGRSSIPSPIHPSQPPAAPVKETKRSLKVNNDQVWKSVEGLKETFLGFHLYSPQLLLPNLERNVNGVIEIRVPAKYLTYGNVKVKKRALWGTDIYTDDSDIVAMAIHSGKFEPQFIEPTLEMEDPFVLAVSGKYKESCKAAKKLALRGKRYIDRNHRLVPDYDLKVTVRVLPTLQHYAGSIRHRIKSREWKKHDGMSLYVAKVEKLKRGEAQLRGRSGLKSVKHFCRERATVDNVSGLSDKVDTTTLSSGTATPESVSSTVRLTRTEKGRVKKPPRVLRLSQKRSEFIAQQK